MANIFVRKTGNDSNNGLTKETAKLTLTAAWGAAANNDTIYIGAGLYHNDTLFTGYKTGMRIIGDTSGSMTGDGGKVVFTTSAPNREFNSLEASNTLYINLILKAPDSEYVLYRSALNEKFINCVLHGGYGASFNGTLINTVIVGQYAMDSGQGTPVLSKNCIFAYSTASSVKGVTQTTNYTVNVSAANLGTLFVDHANHDYTVVAGHQANVAGMGTADVLIPEYDINGDLNDPEDAWIGVAGPKLIPASSFDVVYSNGSVKNNTNPLLVSPTNTLFLRVPNIIGENGYVESSTLTVRGNGTLSGTSGSISIAPVVEDWNYASFNPADFPTIQSSQSKTITIEDSASVKDIDVTDIARYLRTQSTQGGIVLYSTAHSLSLRKDIQFTVSYIFTILEQPGVVGSATVQMSWLPFVLRASAEGARVDYILQLADDTNFTANVITVLTSTDYAKVTQAVNSLTPEHTYYARLKVNFSTGSVVDQSDAFTTTTGVTVIDGDDVTIDNTGMHFEALGGSSLVTMGTGGTTTDIARIEYQQWTDFLTTFSKIIYVDFVNGNDSSGDGTINNPYKTFTKGYTMLQTKSYAFTNLSTVGANWKADQRGYLPSRTEDISGLATGAATLTHDALQPTVTYDFGTPTQFSFIELTQAVHPITEQVHRARVVCVYGSNDADTWTDLTGNVAVDLKTTLVEFTPSTFRYIAVVNKGPNVTSGAQWKIVSLKVGNTCTKTNEALYLKGGPNQEYGDYNGELKKDFTVLGDGAESKISLQGPYSYYVDGGTGSSGSVDWYRIQMLNLDVYVPYPQTLVTHRFFNCHLVGKVSSFAIWSPESTPAFRNRLDNTSLYNGQCHLSGIIPPLEFSLTRTGPGEYNSGGLGSLWSRRGVGAPVHMYVYGGISGVVSNTLDFDFKTVRPVGTILFGTYNNGASYKGTGYTVEVSNDNTNWTMVVPSYTPIAGTNEIMLPKGTTCRYMKVTVSGIDADGWYVPWMELYAGGWSTNFANPYTHQTYEYAVTDKAKLYTLSGEDVVFGKSYLLYYASSGDSFDFDYGRPTEVQTFVMEPYRMPYASVNNPQYTNEPKVMEIAGSNDSKSWTSLTGRFEFKATRDIFGKYIVSLPYKVKYRHYRFIIWETVAYYRVGLNFIMMSAVGANHQVINCTLDVPNVADRYSYTAFSNCIYRGWFYGTSNDSTCKDSYLNCLINGKFIPNMLTGFIPNSDATSAGWTFGSTFQISGLPTINTIGNGTGVNPDGSPANLGIFGGQYATGYGANTINVPTQGTVWYVDADSGSDTTGNGSISQPFAYIDAAVTAASSGDTIRLKASSKTYYTELQDTGKALKIIGDDARNTSISSSYSYTLGSQSQTLSFYRISFYAYVGIGYNATAILNFYNCVLFTKNPNIGYNSAGVGKLFNSIILMSIESPTYIYSFSYMELTNSILLSPGVSTGAMDGASNSLLTTSIIDGTFYASGTSAGILSTTLCPQTIRGSILTGLASDYTGAAVGEDNDGSPKAIGVYGGLATWVAPTAVPYASITPTPLPNVLVSEPPTQGTVWHVNQQTGSDTTGDGTSLLPFATFTKAHTSASSGDTIRLHGANNYTDFNDNPITKNLYIIGDAGHTTSISTVSYYVWAYSTANVKVYRMKMKGVHIYRLASASATIEFHNCYIFNSYGLVHYGNNTPVKFYNCVIDSIGAAYFALSGHSYCENCLFIGTTNRFGADNPLGLPTRVVTSFINTTWIDDSSSAAVLNAAATSGVTVDADYNITAGIVWQNVGTGLNPDGTQAHIGLYGGSHPTGFSNTVPGGVVVSDYILSNSAIINLHTNGLMLIDGPASAYAVLPAIDIAGAAQIYAIGVTQDTALTASSNSIRYAIGSTNSDFFKWDGSEWLSLSTDISSTGMTKASLEAITPQQWALFPYNNTDELFVKININADTGIATVSEVTVTLPNFASGVGVVSYTYDVTGWNIINTFATTGTLVVDSEVRFLVSHDAIDYFAWNGTTWEPTNVSNIASAGMTLAELNNADVLGFAGATTDLTLASALISNNLDESPLLTGITVDYELVPAALFSNVVSFPTAEIGYQYVWDGTQYNVQDEAGVAFDDPIYDAGQPEWEGYFTSPAGVKLRALNLGTVIGGQVSSIKAFEVINTYTNQDFSISLKAYQSGTAAAEFATYALLPDAELDINKTKVEMSFLTGESFSPTYPLPFTLVAGQKKVIYVRITPQSVSSQLQTFQIRALITAL